MNVARLLVRALGSVLIILGVLFWSGNALALIPVHMLLGILLWLRTGTLAAAYPPHEFWKSNPANHAQRWTQVCAIVLALLAAERLARMRGPAVRVVEVFGTSSLAAYFFHLMLLYFPTSPRTRSRRCEVGKAVLLAAVLGAGRAVDRGHVGAQLGDGLRLRSPHRSSGLVGYCQWSRQLIS